MNDDQGKLRAAGIWLALGSILFVGVFAFHGPLHPDLEMQMRRIADAASRWEVVHWTAAVALSCFGVAALLVLVGHSRLTAAGFTASAWAIVLVGAFWTLTTAVVEVTVLADLAVAGDLPQYRAWWSFAEGNANGFSLLAIAVAVIAWNQANDAGRVVPRCSALTGVGAGLTSAAGWVLGVWFDVGPANLLWVVASSVMCLWMAWLGVSLATTSPVDGLGDPTANATAPRSISV